MIEALTLLVLAAVCGLSHIERRHWADERGRLTRAALASTPQQAAAAVTPPARPEPGEARKQRIVQAY